ncbi:RNA-directed DNA polymerase, eukaryota, reverse transcriptase zinc-binding domain protein [Tanacetum coccineum]
MSNIYTICRNEGFLDLNIHHVGGYWIWIQFPSSTACSKFQENESLKRLYSVKRAPSSNFKVDEHILWIEISGLPLFEINKELFEATVQEIGSWCIKINDDYIDISSNGKLKDLDISSKSIDDHSVDDLEHIQTNLNNIDDLDFEQKMEHNGDNKECKKDIHKIIPQQPLNEDVNNKVSKPECKAESSDLSRPPGFEFMKKSPSFSSKCSTSFARYRKKDINGVQESKMTRLKLFWLKTMWGNFAFDYVCSMARGCSRVGDCYMVNIYGPQDQVSKLALWNRLQDFMHHHNGSYIMFGDMNAVKNEQERVGSIFNNIEDDHFNSFIDATDLVDLPVRENVIDLIPDIRITALDRIWSDHNPILLHVDKIDFGPSPFKLYNSWLLRDGFDDLIKSEWDLLDSNKTENRKAVDFEEITSIEKKIDEGSASP